MTSLIIPVYNNEPTLQELNSRITKTFSDLREDYEIFYVDDGSRDKSFEILKAFSNKNSHIKIIKLMRNFGQSQAILAGFQYAKGDVIVTLDADLQYNPEDIPKLLKKIGDGFEIVCGWRKNRKDHFLSRKLPSYFANLFARIKLQKNIKDIGCHFIALKRNITTQIKNYGHTARFLKPLLIKLSNNICEIDIEHHLRKKNKSQYGLAKLIKIALDFFINFSFKPIHKNTPLFIIEEVIG